MTPEAQLGATEAAQLATQFASAARERPYNVSVNFLDVFKNVFQLAYFYFSALAFAS